jgi:hypothetical protein
MGSIAAAAATAEKVVDNVMKVEPTIAGIAGMFVPGMAVVQPWIVMLAPFLERALTDISNQNGGDILAAFLELVQHVSPNQPNASALTDASAEESGIPTGSPIMRSPPTTDPSAQGG